MKKVLIIGATGQLGAKVTQKLAAQKDYTLRAFVRQDSQHGHLPSVNTELVFGDLTDRESISQAVEGCDFIIATANAVIPRKKQDTFEAVDIQGYRDLIDAAKKYGVDQFIYISANMDADRFSSMPMVRSKVQTEAYLKASGVPYTIFRPEAFMDVYFAFMGTPIPLRNEPVATIKRPFPFMQKFFQSVKSNVENGRLGIIGKETIRHSYIAIEDVAAFAVKAIGHPDLINTTHLLGGPENLSALDLKAVFEKVLGKELQFKKTPAFMMKLMGGLFSWFNPAVSNLFKLNYSGAVQSTKVDSQELARKLGIALTSAEAYLRSKVESAEAVGPVT